MENLYALIMAGGGGTRLWPESRLALPKQFIQLFREKSLLQIAFDRITPLVPPSRVFVATGQQYKEIVRKMLPDLPVENIITEPCGRNTAPAIGLGAVHLLKRDPNAVMAALTADHIMHREDIFRAALESAAGAAQSGRIVTLGIRPSGPETGYGYIERGGLTDGAGFYPVVRFREKPDLETAKRFVESGRFYWNSGMFIWRVDVVLGEMARQLPDLHRALLEIEACLGAADQETRIERIWSAIRPISIDYGIMEGAGNVHVLPVDPGWTDVGSWSAVYDEILDQREKELPDGNVVQKGELLAIDTHGCLVRSDKLVAAIGLRDLVIVDTGDALLICPHDQTQRVKELVDMLKERGRAEYR